MKIGFYTSTFNDRPVEEEGTRIFLDWSPEYAYVIDPPKEEE